MSLLLDESNTRAWPPQGWSGSGAVPEAQAPHEPASVESLAARAVSSCTAAELGDKIASVESAPNLRDIWRHPDAHPVVLMLMLIDKYGMEYAEWHPDVLRLTVERDGIALSNKVWNKIMAGRVVLASPSPWRQWEVFHWVCRALAGESPNFVYLEEPELGHLVVGYEIMQMVDKRETSFEVDKFIAATFKSAGVPYIPQPLNFAQRELEDTQLECKTCEALHRDDNDTACVSCGGKDLRRVPFEFEGLKTEIREMFETLGKLPLAAAVESLPDTAVGSAVYRLLVEWDLAKTVKAQMIQQLRMIGGK